MVWWSHLEHLSCGVYVLSALVLMLWYCTIIFLLKSCACLSCCVDALLPACSRKRVCLLQQSQAWGEATGRLVPVYCLLSPYHVLLSQTLSRSFLGADLVTHTPQKLCVINSQKNTRLARNQLYFARKITLDIRIRRSWLLTGMVTKIVCFLANALPFYILHLVHS